MVRDQVCLIEDLTPILGLDRCWLLGALGDALHALSCALGYNIRWLMRAIVRLGIGVVFFAPVFGCSHGAHGPAIQRQIVLCLPTGGMGSLWRRPADLLAAYIGLRGSVI